MCQARSKSQHSEGYRNPGGALSWLTDRGSSQGKITQTFLAPNYNNSPKKCHLVVECQLPIWIKNSQTLHFSNILAQIHTNDVFLHLISFSERKINWSSSRNLSYSVYHLGLPQIKPNIWGPFSSNFTQNLPSSQGTGTISWHLLLRSQNSQEGLKDLYKRIMSKIKVPQNMACKLVITMACSALFCSI